MDWKLFFLTFGSIFLAELGDKTQIGVLGFSMQSGKTWTIFTAACLALSASTLVAVLVGGLLGKYVQPRLLRLGGGVLFVLIGLWVCYSELKNGG